MRIITGKYKGRKLYTLEGMNTRPMMDKMKESVFNIIGPYFDGDIVLDLFGGSGALSLESISRGASFSYIVEKNNGAINVIKKNIEMVNEAANTKILSLDYKVALNFLKKENVKFDIIFLDPPFRMNIIDDIIKYLLDNYLINSYGYIICQYQKNNHSLYSNEQLELIKHYNWAINEVAIYRFIK